MCRKASAVAWTFVVTLVDGRGVVLAESPSALVVGVVASRSAERTDQAMEHAARAEIRRADEARQAERRKAEEIRLAALVKRAEEVRLEIEKVEAALKAEEARKLAEARAEEARKAAEAEQARKALRGGDAAIVNGDVLEHFKKDSKIAASTNHSLSHSLIPSRSTFSFVRRSRVLEDLAGKPVNFNTHGTAAAYSARSFSSG